MRDFHVFALTSREDPFPITALESLALGVPVVCFKTAGGIPELIGSDCGTAVPYLDLRQMADEILWFTDDRLRAEVEIKCRQRIQDGFLINDAARQIGCLITETLA
jgi:glycosyltransferase involved in cell wall biosynthesis